MSIIIVTTAEEAAAVLREMDAPFFKIETGPVVTAWSGVATDLAATTAAPVEDIDDRKPRGRKWTPQDESVLKRGIRSGLSCRQVGERLGRSASSVNNKLIALESERTALNLPPIRPAVKK